MQALEQQNVSAGPEWIGEMTNRLVAPWRDALCASDTFCPSHFTDEVEFAGFLGQISPKTEWTRPALEAIAGSFLSARPTLQQLDLFLSGIVAGRVLNTMSVSIELLSAVDLSTANLSSFLSTKSVHEACEAWQRFRRVGAAAPTALFQLLGWITERLEKEAESAQTLNSYLRLAEEDRIADYGLRETIYKGIVSRAAKLLGQDDNTDRFFGEFSKIVEKLHATLPIVDRVDVTNRVAVAVLAQQQGCKFVRDIASQFSDTELSFSAVLPIVVEGFLQATRRSEAGNQAMLDFLIEPFSKPSFLTLVNVIGINPVEYFRSSNVPTDQSDKSVLKTAVTYGRFIHQNFWALPLAGRAAAAKELILSAHSDAAEDSIPKPILERTLSTKAMSLDPVTFGATVRWFGMYLEASKPYERYFGLGALLTAAEPGAGRTGRAGEVLGTVAGHMGPAEQKIAQGASADSRTRADIRADLASAKYDITPPSRPDLVEWVEQRRNEIELSYNGWLRDQGVVRERITIENIGKILGSASISVTVALKMTDGTTRVLALRRPYAIENGQRGFDTVVEMLRLDREASQIKTANGTEPEEGVLNDSAVYDVVSDLAVMSRERLSLETNFRIAAIQYSQLDGIARSSSVTVDGTRFESSAPKVLLAGEDFFMMELVAGDNLDRLKQAGKLDATLEQRACMKTLTTELWNILQLKFDPDRHVGQIHFESVSDFLVRDHQLDAKALAVRAWTAEEVDLFAAVLFKAAPNAISSGNLFESFINAQRTLSVSINPHRGLVGEVQKALVSLGDYHQRISNEDARRCMMAALRAGVSDRLAMSMRKQGFEITPLLSRLKDMPTNGIDLVSNS